MRKPTHLKCLKTTKYHRALYSLFLFASANSGIAAPNLIVNGSFENPAYTGPVTAASFSASIPGWAGIGDTIEYSVAATYGVSSATGSQVIELDANVKGAGTGLYQMVTTVASQNYTLFVDVAAREGTGAATNSVEVWWRGQRVGTIEPSSNKLTTYSFEVQGSGGSDRLEFREQAGDDDSLGGIIDNVRLEIANTLPVGIFKARLRAAHVGGKCLDDPYALTTAGNVLWQYECNGSTAQQFTFNPVAGKENVYALVVAASNMCVDVNAGSTAWGAQFIQWPCHGGLNQQFKAIDAGKGRYYLQPQNSGLFMEVNASSTANGAKVQQWGNNGGYDNQKWYIEYDTPIALKGISPPSVPGLLTPDSSRSDIITPVVVDKSAAIALGKALFWDQAIGSDGMACASCHFHAGVDFRIKNMVNPGFTHGNFTFEPTASGAPRSGPNYTLKKADFPFNPSNDDVVSSSGVFDQTYNGSSPSNIIDSCSPNANSVFNVGSVPVRQVEPRKTPTTINAAYNFRNFWDGRANNVFNGTSPFGLRDKSAGVFINSGGITKRPLNLVNSSLASQAVGPVLSTLEMSCAKRQFADVGRKVLPRKPLANQTVHSSDSVLSSLVGSSTTYADLVRNAFNPAYWNGACSTCGTPANGGSPYSQMEANFPMFFGLAVQLYESTLVSDDTKFDKWKQGSASMTSEEQLGHDIFNGKGECSSCHSGPTFTSAALISNNKQQVERMAMKNGVTALYDTGFYNLGVVPTNYDLGLGDKDPWGNPLSFSAQYKSGIFVDKFSTDSCRFEIPYAPNCSDSSGKANDPLAVAGSFKVPTLRNIALTGPYMHNGSLSTLEQVVDFYNRGGNFNNLEKHPDIQPLGLSATEKSALVAFLKSLTDDRVAYERAPFDHPSLPIPNGHVGNDWAVLPGNSINPSLATDEFLVLPAVGSSGVPTPIKAFHEILP